MALPSLDRSLARKAGRGNPPVERCPPVCANSRILDAYIHNYDVKTLNTLLLTQTPKEVVATFSYLSDREKSFACRALFDQWAKCLGDGWRGLPPHLMEWMARQRFNGHAGDDTPGAFDA